MLASFDKNGDLAASLKQVEFVRATIDQINKDLNGFHEEIPEPYPVDVADPIVPLTEIVTKILMDLLRNEPERLAQFMYRVDLGEARFRTSLASDTSLQDLAYRVIEREAQKVFLRLKFSTGR